jgi:hypothetical protein
MAMAQLPDMSRILIIGDSHCHSLDAVITEQFPNIEALSIARGRKINGVLNHFMFNLQAARSFDPTITVIHVGHNELAYDEQLNKHPLLSIPTAASTIILARQIQNQLPTTRIILSAVLPRTHKIKSSMSQVQTMQYNRVAKKHGQRIRTEARRAGFQQLINSCMWSCITHAREVPTHYTEDGLHLNLEGKRALTSSWIAKISMGDID